MYQNLRTSWFLQTQCNINLLQHYKIEENKVPVLARIKPSPNLEGNFSLRLAAVLPMTEASLEVYINDWILYRHFQIGYYQTNKCHHLEDTTRSILGIAISNVFK
jgi:hypothetical protein